MSFRPQNSYSILVGAKLSRPNSLLWFHSQKHRAVTMVALVLIKGDEVGVRYLQHSSGSFELHGTGMAGQSDTKVSW